jgi:hypothetical protein
MQQCIQKSLNYCRTNDSLFQCLEILSYYLRLTSGKSHVIRVGNHSDFNQPSTQSLMKQDTVCKHNTPVIKVNATPKAVI